MTKIQKNTTNKVNILNPHDSQGVQIADGLGIYPCLRGCGGGGYQQGYVLQHIIEDTHTGNIPVSFTACDMQATEKGTYKKAMFCDIYNFQITGDVSCNLNASSCNSPTHSGPSILILNDQGGDIMNVADDVTSTLRAQDHGHPPVVCIAFDVYNMQGNENVFKTLNSVATDSDHVPVVCFEPGILSRDCSAGNRAYTDVCSTLRAQMGDNQPAICFQLCGDRDAPSISVSDKAYCIPANPMSDREQAICIEKENYSG